jgi:hypothetical protein
MGGILAKEKLPEKEACSEEESSDNEEEEERREVHNLQDFYEHFNSLQRRFYETHGFYEAANDENDEEEQGEIDHGFYDEEEQGEIDQPEEPFQQDQPEPAPFQQDQPVGNNLHEEVQPNNQPNGGNPFEQPNGFLNLNPFEPAQRRSQGG